MNNYYDRDNIVHLDGTHIFHKPQDERAEHEVSSLVAAAWHCELHRFGALCPIDWYATRFGRMTGVLELKSRSHAFAKYPTVFLNVRKWLALQLASVGLGVPAIFVVRFTDRISWVPLNKINARAEIGGCRELVKSRSDIEPVFNVPVDLLRTLKNQEPRGGDHGAQVGRST